MNNKPRIIVLTLAYNCESYIEETLASIKAQTYNNYCHILIENGSTDGTRDIIRKHLDDFDERTIYLESDYNSFNEPEKYTLPDWWDISQAQQYDYFTILDSDDIFENDALTLMAEAAAQYDSDIVYAGCRMFDDGDFSRFVERKPAFDKYYCNMQDVAKDWILMYGSIRVVWGNLYRCTLFRESEKIVSQYGLVNGLDTLHNLIMLGMSKNLVTISQSVIKYRMRSNSVYKARLNTDRYMAYDYIRDESVKLLDKWNCTDPRTYFFVEQCRESAMYDLVNNLTESRENYENNCKLLYNILTDEGFADGIEKYKLKDPFFQKTVETIQNNRELLFEYRYQNFAMMILYGIINNNKWLYLAGLFSEDNSCFWGASYIYEKLLPSDPWMKKIFVGVNWGEVFINDRDCITKVINEDYVQAARRLPQINISGLQEYKTKDWIKRAKILQDQKQEIKDALDNGKNIDKLINRVLKIKPLDKDILRYVLVYDIDKKNNGRLLDISLVIQNVFKDDPDMLYMAALAFEHLEMPENAVECLEIAMTICSDSEQKAEIQSEIDRLKVTE